MWELFTAEARDAVMDAQVEARELGHDHVGTEHLLLALLRLPDGVSPRVFARLGVTLDGARAEVQRLVKRTQPGLTDADADALRTLGIDLNEVRRRAAATFGPGALDAPAATRLVFTSRAKKVMEVAMRESMRLGHRDIGAEHLLLGVAASDGLCAEILQSVGSDLSMVRVGVLEELGRAA